VIIEDLDYALVGGGLQNALIALAVRAAQPQARIAMIERGAAPGGNHTWCFHAGDLAAQTRDWIMPLVVTEWPGYEVAFPEVARSVASTYACVTSERVAEQVTAALAVPGSHLLTSTTATEIAANHVVVRDANGVTQTLRATAVIDSRGPDRASEANCGWQKFVGCELELTAPHGLSRPILMDATVPQIDGFRFVYVLPLSPTRVLVEDTYFSDTAYLDVSAVRTEVMLYAARRGWLVSQHVRDEVGVLPLPWRVTAPTVSAPLVGGYAGGWFHPVTGYSFPIAVRVAAAIAAGPPGAVYSGALVQVAEDHARQLRFAGILNHMLFRWFAPDQRYNVLERFYRRLPESTIRRFYALELTAMDRARILVGRPPRGLSWRAALGMEAS
jgi:lycopene beta-cyclase